MKKFILLLLFTISLLFGADIEKENDGSQLSAIIQDLQNVNSQIQILKAQSDLNSTSSLTNLSVLQKRKTRLLSQIPNLIMQTNINQKDIDNIIKDKGEIERRIKRYENTKNKSLYIKNSITFETLSIDESFYSSVIKIRNFFKQNTNSSTIKNFLENRLIDLQTSSYTSIKDLQDSLGGDGFSQEFNALELHRQTCEEILTYLKDNAELFSTNFFLSKLNFKMAINYINKNIPFSDKFNVGKIVIITFVFIFFMSFIRILPKIAGWILISTLAKNYHLDTAKDQIVAIIKSPIKFLLITYSLDVCSAILYYPAPVTVGLVTFFSVVYIAGFCWLILKILNGYGLVLINEITKKSGRKEVINLFLKILYFIIIIIACLMILSRLGFDVSALIASLGIGGLAVAFAAKDIIANFFASVMLLFDNSFSQGDWIICGDIQGTVVEIGLRKTTVRSFDNALIFVPNSKLTSDPIRNNSRRRMGRNIKMSVGVTYDSSPQAIAKTIDDIREMLFANDNIAKPDGDESLQKNEYRLRHMKNIISIKDLAGYKDDIIVALDELAGSSINIFVYCFSKTISWNEFMLVKQEVIFNIIDIVNKNGLSFAFPSQSLYIETPLKISNENIVKESSNERI